MARPVCLQSLRLLPNVGVCFVLVGTSERFLRGPREMYGPRPYANKAWKACDMLIGFSLQRVHRFESPRLSDMSTTCLWQSSRSKLMNLMSLLVIDVVLLNTLKWFATLV
jgi:hypothetical protein